jgi:hypothetical protein
MMSFTLLHALFHCSVCLFVSIIHTSPLVYRHNGKYVIQYLFDQFLIREYIY